MSKEKAAVPDLDINRYFRDDEIWMTRGNPAFPEHDAAGFRNPDRPGTDIFIVGDSWTYGHGVTKTESWPILLSQNFGVTCCAAGGWGSFQYFMAVQELMPVSTKICLIGFYLGNDLVDAFKWTKNSKSPLRHRFWCDEFDRVPLIMKWKDRVRNYQIREIMAVESISKIKAFELAHQRDNIDILAFKIEGIPQIFRPRQRAELINPEIQAVRVGLELTKAMFVEIIDICENSGIEPLFVIFPSKEACFAASRPGLHPEMDIVLSHEVEVKKELKALFREHDVSNTDVIEVLSKQPERLFFANSLDAHPNSEGTKVIATYLEEVLSPLLEKFDNNNLHTFKINMQETKTKRVIVVLGAGRSGTSLLMQVLVSMGMRISENLITANISNPEGPLEDLDIFETHKNLFNELGGHRHLPLPDKWVNSNPVKKAKLKLEHILTQRINLDNTIWGFKDPRVNSFLPLWFSLFISLRIIPVFVLAVRNPKAVVTSFLRQYNHPTYISELVWLTRTIDALHHTAADCFIVHYEDWFTQPSKLAQELLKYTGLDEYFTGNVDEVLKDIIKPNLNRSVHEEYQVQNKYVLKLYDALKECRGADFDRARLMAVVKECRQAMDEFKGWYLIAQENIARVSTLREQLQTAKEKQAEIPELRKRIRELERENQRLSEMEKEILRADQALNHLQELYPQNPTHDRL
ncbi:sulfotransferase family protein [Okeania hirsuta]|uniref:SGNH/GDSL hydrolase family protein n=1 Tax=Okeania hirsuta TaxID=1458930 RepID=A0A3N6P379_9CYAN|nr:hypothetical protein [Okeania hirsuta]RQH23992.1 hypothetical protein D4Z78_05140 [Okeania hirsuta]RQH29541.1 hypothetical protein D5R40_24695 [Okeania hirsuta]